MIGHYLLTLTAAQEDRVLTSHMHPGSYGCLLGVAERWAAPALFNGSCRTEPGRGLIVWVWRSLDPSVGHRYDRLCERFGAPPVNIAIRNRILSNRARRVLQNIPVGVGEDRPAL